MQQLCRIYVISVYLYVVMSNTYSVVFLFFYGLLPVSLYCPCLIAPSVFSSVYSISIGTDIFQKNMWNSNLTPPQLWFVLCSIIWFERWLFVLLILVEKKPKAWATRTPLKTVDEFKSSERVSISSGDGLNFGVMTST